MTNARQIGPRTDEADDASSSSRARRRPGRVISARQYVKVARCRAVASRDDEAPRSAIRGAASKASRQLVHAGSRALPATAIDKPLDGLEASIQHRASSACAMPIPPPTLSLPFRAISPPCQARSHSTGATRRKEIASRVIDGLPAPHATLLTAYDTGWRMTIWPCTDGHAAATMILGANVSGAAASAQLARQSIKFKCRRAHFRARLATMRRAPGQQHFSQ